jgi:hypothetical protein
MKDFIKTTNKWLERGQNESLKNSFNESQILVETNSNQDLETQDDDKLFICSNTNFYWN